MLIHVDSSRFRYVILPDNSGLISNEEMHA